MKFEILSTQVLFWGWMYELPTKQDILGDSSEEME